MKPFIRLEPCLAGSRAKRAALALATATCALALPIAASAAKGGKPGGGGGGGGTEITINPVPKVIASPVTYTTTELHWSGDLNENGIADHTEETFVGIAAIGVNNRGFVVGSVYGPASADPALNNKRTAFVRLDPSSAGVVSLDVVFATALQTLNDNRPATEEPWRIAYGTRINDDGLIACRLIPASAPYRVERDEAIERGIDPTPVLYAMVDLSRSDAADALMLVPISTSPDGDFLDIGELGDVLMFDHDAATNTYLARLFPLAEDADGTLGYHLENEVSIPALTSWPVSRPSINAARELIYRMIPEEKLVRYSTMVDEQTILVQNEKFSFFANGISTDGTAFISAYEFVTTGKGRNQQTTRLDYPIHIISPNERTPLTDPAIDGNASIPHFAWCASNAAAPGEAEVLIQFEGTLEHQIYKPNLGARFPVPIVGQAYWATISPPVDQTVTTDWDPASGTGTYAAGFISYSLNEDGFYRGFVLQPNSP